MNITREQLYFESIKESRGPYFVDYQPPIASNPYAILNLVYPGEFVPSEVATSMRSEMESWIKRYPVPLMVFAFDAAENVIRPNDAADDGVLVGWLVPNTQEIAFSWKLNEVPKLLNDTTSIPDWRKIYKDVPFRTDTGES
jgi:hypothetical protein